MGTSDSGAWKLLIYPMALILILAILLSLTVTPFVEEGISLDTPADVSFFRTALLNLIDSGNVFNVTKISIPLLVTTYDIPIPNIFKVFGTKAYDFIVTQINVLLYLPEWFALPFTILLLLSLAYIGAHIIASFIP